MGVLFAIQLALVVGAAAQGPEDPARPEVWSVAGKVVLRLHATVGDVTPRRRVELLDERLTEILSKVERPIGVADIEMHEAGSDVTITVCGDLLVTVLPGDAAPNKTTPAKLGRMWLSSLRKTVPLLSPRVNRGGA
jgi:hypothetical protein